MHNRNKEIPQKLDSEILAATYDIMLIFTGFGAL